MRRGVLIGLLLLAGCGGGEDEVTTQPRGTEKLSGDSLAALVAGQLEAQGAKASGVICPDVVNQVGELFSCTTADGLRVDGRVIEGDDVEVGPPHG